MVVILNCVSGGGAGALASELYGKAYKRKSVRRGAFRLMGNITA
jgi:hypothetical protein